VFLIGISVRVKPNPKNGNIVEILQTDKSAPQQRNLYSELDLTQTYRNKLVTFVWKRSCLPAPQDTKGILADRITAGSCFQRKHLFCVLSDRPAAEWTIKRQWRHFKKAIRCWCLWGTKPETVFNAKHNIGAIFHKVSSNNQFNQISRINTPKHNLYSAVSRKAFPLQLLRR
jgi:hypothetical protein